MAVAGDIMIKVAADLAEFTRGMTEAASRLEDFGKHAKQEAQETASAGLLTAEMFAFPKRKATTGTQRKATAQRGTGHAEPRRTRRR